MFHLFFLFGPLLLAAEGAPPAKAPAAPPAKPEVRTVQLNTGKLQFVVRVTPGAPDPGRVVDVKVEMAEIPPAPDPIYGERIPVKEAKLAASVADQDGSGFRVSYVAHPLPDAGAYGFHFTPLRSDTYLLELSGRHQGSDFKAALKVPVGIWPFPAGIDERSPDSEGGSSARLPAVPTSIGSPAQPATTTSPVGVSSPFKSSMAAMGEAFARLGVALLMGRQPDFGEAGAAVAALKTALSGITGSGGGGGGAPFPRRPEAGRRRREAFRAHRRQGRQGCGGVVPRVGRPALQRLSPGEAVEAGSRRHALRTRSRS